MKNRIRTLAVGGLLALAASAASADVTVNYIAPERFSDLPFAPWERDDVLKHLTEHFAKLGAKLPPGQNLRIEVQDVDLAGRIHPTRANDIRVISNRAEGPRIDLHYTVESDGQVVRSGEAQLRDLGFLDRGSSHYAGDDNLRYERRMIDDWFYATIMPRERAAQR